MNNSEIERARQLTSDIRALAIRDDYRGLLAVESDPDTERLLDLLSNDLSAGARVHLEAARRWRQRKQDANRRRLEEAGVALDGFDPALARALIGRIEEDWLTAEDAVTRDELLIRAEARTMETEELSTLAAETINEYGPPRRWWRRKKNR